MFTCPAPAAWPHRNLQEFVEHIVTSTNMRSLSPISALDASCNFLAANLYAKSIFGRWCCWLLHNTHTYTHMHTCTHMRACRRPCVVTRLPGLNVVSRVPSCVHRGGCPCKRLCGEPSRRVHQGPHSHSVKDAGCGPESWGQDHRDPTPPEEASGALRLRLSLVVLTLPALRLVPPPPPPHPPSPL
jgi:hypothetical protein